MPAPLSPFNPQSFFESSAYYASQGRALFKFLNRPIIGNRLKGIDWTVWNLGWDILMSGLAAKQSTLPMHQMHTHEAYALSGPTRKVPHTQFFSDLNVEFLLMGQTPDHARALYHTLTLWQELIAGGNFDTTQINKTPAPDVTHFTSSYFDDYTVDGELIIYAPQKRVGSSEMNGELIMLHNKYLNTYPLSVGNITASWDMPDTPVLLDVTFTFYYAQSVISTDISRESTATSTP